jgi:hypothetical protein
MVLQVTTYSFFYKDGTVEPLIRNTVMRCVGHSLWLQKNVTLPVRIFECTFSLFTLQPAEWRPCVSTVGSRFAYSIRKLVCLFGCLTTECLLLRRNGVQSNGT